MVSLFVNSIALSFEKRQNKTKQLEPKKQKLRKLAPEELFHARVIRIFLVHPNSIYVSSVYKTAVFFFFFFHFPDPNSVVMTTVLL